MTSAEIHHILQEPIQSTKWFAHAMTGVKSSVFIACRFQIKCNKKEWVSGKCLMGASEIYWKVEIGKFGNNLTISFGNFGNKLWTQKHAVGTKSFGPLVQFQS